MLFVLVEPIFNNELVVTESQCQAAATGYRRTDNSLMFAALTVSHNSIYIAGFFFSCSALWHFQNSSCVAAWSALILVQINYSIYDTDNLSSGPGLDDSDTAAESARRRSLHDLCHCYPPGVRWPQLVSLPVSSVDSMGMVQSLVT